MVWAPLLEKRPKSPIDTPPAIAEHTRIVNVIRDAAHELSGIAAMAVEQPMLTEEGTRGRALLAIKALHGAIDDATLSTATDKAH